MLEPQKTMCSWYLDGVIFAKNNARRDVIVAVFWSIAYISGSMLSCGSVEWRHHKQIIAIKQCPDAVWWCPVMTSQTQKTIK